VLRSGSRTRLSEKPCDVEHPSTRVALLRKIRMAVS
jgi:hypothetical protein